MLGINIHIVSFINKTIIGLVHHINQLKIKYYNKPHKNPYYVGDEVKVWALFKEWDCIIKRFSISKNNDQWIYHIISKCGNVDGYFTIDKIYDCKRLERNKKLNKLLTNGKK